jgi:hypothetical protein
MTRDAIERFPIAGHGRRNDAMVRLVESLLGRRFALPLILATVEEWHGHYHALGRCRTDPRLAHSLAYTCVESLLESPGFTWSTMTQEDHLAECRMIQLGEDQTAMLSAPVRHLIHKVSLIDPFTTGGAESPIGRVSHIMEGCLPDRRLLCDPGTETFFVEAWALHAIHQLCTQELTAIKATDSMIQSIASDRHGIAPWGRAVINRMKDRYIARLDKQCHCKPANRFELLRETEKGKPGTPSAYEATGIRLFLPAPTV